ncbi:unnamed protein product [Paramecium pentaurelia]|uniref:Cyclic nucleotide-binding domain-containing protein n=1 Tax=Paramecium pentaurelia TaxID=43138 RepID=A0A8S1TZF5_9CILI|nr:unnamed protein product [Paramecium pentaurelia]
MKTKQRRSISSESKKPSNDYTFRTIQLATPQIEYITSRSTTASVEKKLHKLGKLRNEQNLQLNNTINYDDQSIRNSLLYQNEDWGKFEFPSWLKSRTDFMKLRKSKHFDYHLQVFSICEQDPFRRSEELIEIVAHYLVKLDFFRLMPYKMIKQISSRLQAKSYEEDEIICKKGEKGDSMYIIFDGKVEVIGQKKQVLGPKSLIDRNSLEFDYFRNNTLQAITVTHLLILNRIEYITILNHNMKAEHLNHERFIKSHQLFSHFPDERLNKFCSLLQGKYLTTNETLYSIGDLIDYLYIVKQGTLARQIVMDLEDQNRWPINQKKWLSQIITRTISFNIEFEIGQLVGYSDIIDSDFDSEKKRKETIYAKTDCFLLYVSKSQFFQVFTQADIQYFQNYQNQNPPLTQEQLVKDTRQKQNEQKQKLQMVNQAIYSHLRQFSFDYETLKKKEQKYEQVTKNQKKASREFTNRYKIIRREKKLKLISLENY